MNRAKSNISKLGLVTLAFCTAVWIGGCSQSKAPKPPTPHVNTVVAISSTIPITKEYIGITQSIASVDIRARVQGFLTKMNFVEGKPVKKNQLLFIIDPKPFEAKLDLAQGQLSQSIATKEYQQIEYLRMKELVVKGDVSKSRFDQVASRFNEAVAQVEISTAKVEVAKINLSYCYMYSPVDGIISHKYVDVGNLVGGAESTLLANVVELNPIYVEFSPSIGDFSELLKYRANMPFNVEITLAGDKSIKFSGKIDLINNQADVPTSTILMRAIVENPENLLLPGIYVNLNLKLTDKSSAILIPAIAVMEIQGQRSLYILAEGNKVQPRVIQTGEQIGSSYTVTSGLKAGETVITSNLQKIRPGQVVIPQLTSQ